MIAGKQGGLFSEAIEFKELALNHLDSFELEEALDCLAQAKAIDPYLANLDLLITICEFARGAGARPEMSVLTAVEIWHAAGQAFRHAELQPPAVRQLRQSLAQRLLSGEFTATGFCTAEEKVLHRGVCHLYLEQWQQAHRDLLNLVTEQSHLALPVHWGYLGDSAHALHRGRDLNLAYLRLLFSDPHAFDPITFRHEELLRILRHLEEETGDDSLARALWPIHAWFQGIIEIPPGNQYLLARVQTLKSKSGSASVTSREERLSHFSLCLYLDQSRLYHLVDFSVREEMKALEPELFSEYLAEVARRAR